MNAGRKFSLILLALLLAGAALDAQRPPERQWGVPVAIGVIDGWQVLSSNGMPGGCIYTPSCSIYGELAVRRFGAYRGSWLALKRIFRCSPWGHPGEDWP